MDVKINEKELTKIILKQSKKIIEKELKTQIIEYDIWGNEEIEKVINDCYKDLVKDILKNNLEEIKQQVKEMIIATAQDVAFEQFENILEEKNKIRKD